jgi:hypothetical protein
VKKENYIHIRAWLLSTLLFVAFTAKELHHVFAHHHDAVNICDDAPIGEAHLHDETYIPDECSLCDFTFSIYDFSLPVFSPTYKENVAKKTQFAYISFIFSKKHLFKQLRGPPVVS